MFHWDCEPRKGFKCKEYFRYKVIGVDYGYED